MPRNIHNGVVDISLTTMSTFSHRILPGDGCFAKETLRQKVPADKTSRETEVKRDENSSIKLPVLTRSRWVNEEENKNLQVLLRGIQCFNLTLQESMPELQTSSSQSGPSCSRDLCVSDDNRESTKEDGPVYEQSGENRVQGDKDIEKEKGNVLPPVSSILKGQRLNIREKEGLKTKRGEQLKCKSTEKENKPPCQTDSTSQHSDFEAVLTKSISTDTVTTRSTAVSVRVEPGKRNARPVFHLPKADKYDITPRNIISSKTCAVLNVSQKSSLLKSSYRDSWFPRRDSSVIRNSVSKAFIQQPFVFLRQPSSVAGVKMTLKEHEDALATAIQTVKEINVQPSSVDAVDSKYKEICD